MVTQFLRPNLTSAIDKSKEGIARIGMHYVIFIAQGIAWINHLDCSSSVVI
ncbi:hypothetical protein RR42_m0013 [Cupriavidus basilensis]|uniref:Uncharacterized protein n=1 Tax=Cupriavidus basilensis TaxID=68895 RepID=A0A0C4Y3P6_9BURK|nr:hypothetical protein RR42_m0013 [Cupriavidus basilensis]